MTAKKLAGYAALRNFDFNGRPVTGGERLTTAEMSAEKKRVLLEVCELMGVDTRQAIAVGDGANDLPMMGAAGLSICFHGKPTVREQAMISIESGGMDRALALLR